MDRATTRRLACLGALPPALLAAALIASALLPACGGPQPYTVTPPPPPAWQSVNGAAVLVLPRASGEWVELALWIDAGARNASMPALATAAAWVAADAHAGEVDVQVLADATRFRVQVPRHQLVHGLDVLRDVLSTRQVSPTALAHAQRRVQTARSTRWDDPADVTERRALARLLLGDGKDSNDIDGWDPLGSAADDGAITAPAVTAFLAAHYGPTRALFMAAGEVASEEFQGEVRRRTSVLPGASQPRATPVATSGVGAEVRAGEAEGVVLALAVDRLPRAVALAHGLVHEVGDGFRARVFGLGGRAVVVLRRDGTGALAAATAALPVTALWLSEHREDAPLIGMPTDAWGADWASRHGGPALRDAIRVTVTLPALTERTTQSAKDALARAAGRAQALTAPEPRGDVDRDHADLVWANGARLRVIRRGSDDTVALTVAFAGGAGTDAPREHGLAASLAQLLTVGCDAETRAEFARTGATMSPWVSSSAWGMTIRAPGARWLPAAAAALRCATRGNVTDADAHRARIAAVSAARSAGPMARIAAALLSPDAPGRIAPLGGDARLADLHGERLLGAWHTRRMGRAAVITVVGAVDPVQVAAFMGRRAMLLEGEDGDANAPQASVAATAGPTWLAGESDDDRVHVVLAWTATVDNDVAKAHGSRATDVCARAAVTALARRGGLDPKAAGSADERGLWIAAAITVPPARNADFQSLVANLRADITDDDLARAAANAARDEAFESANPAAFARRMANNATDAPFPDADTLHETCDALLASPLHLYVARPQ